MKTLRNLLIIKIALLTLVACSGQDKSSSNSEVNPSQTPENSVVNSFDRSLETDLPQHLQARLKESNLTSSDLGDLTQWRSYARASASTVLFTPFRIQLSTDNRIAMDLVLEKFEASGFVRCSVIMITNLKASKNSDGSENLSLDLDGLEFISEFGVDQDANDVSKDTCFQKVSLQQVQDVLTAQKTKSGLNIFKRLNQSNEAVEFAGYGSESFKFVREKPSLLAKHQQGCDKPEVSCLP